MEEITRVQFAELADRKIRVNAPSPGPTDAEMFGRVPGEKEGEAIKGVLRTSNPSKRLAERSRARSWPYTLHQMTRPMSLGQTSLSIVELGPLFDSAADSPQSEAGAVLWTTLAF